MCSYNANIGGLLHGAQNTLQEVIFCAIGYICIHLKDLLALPGNLKASSLGV